MCSSVYVTFGDFTVKLSISMVLGRPISRRGLLCFERRPREEGGGSATRGAIGRDTRVTARRRSGRCRSSSVGRIIAAMAGAYLSRVSRCGLGNTVVSVSWFGGRPHDGERGPTISGSNRVRRCFLGQMRATGGVDEFDREKRFVERHASIDGGDFRKRVFSSSITTSRRERRDETVRFRLRSDDDDYETNDSDARPLLETQTCLSLLTAQNCTYRSRSGFISSTSSTASVSATSPNLVM